METIYDWLLHNVGNEGNDFTILNVQRQTNTEGISALEVMARTKDFKRVNLLIEPAKNINPESSATSEEKVDRHDNYIFTSEDEVIAYLAMGETTGSSTDVETPGIRVSVVELTSDSDFIAFPPKSN